jgi:hypothetical protein
LRGIASSLLTLVLRKLNSFLPRIPGLSSLAPELIQLWIIYDTHQLSFFVSPHRKSSLISRNNCH